METVRAPITMVELVVEAATTVAEVQLVGVVALQVAEEVVMLEEYLNPL